jgi:hypothetical protein
MADSTHPQPVQKLRGRVSRGDYGKGSKSEREALFIDTGSDRYLLRRKGGPVFADSELERHVGRTVECDGFLVGSTLLADRIEQVG